MIEKYVPDIVKEKKIDLVIANGENLSHGRGITKKVYDEMSYYIDGFTLGNHTWNSKEVIPLLENNNNIIRPLNYSAETPGEGSMMLTSRSGYSVGVINLIGRTYMEPSDSPFDAVLREIERLRSKTNIIIVDFHAEATSEKIAMAHMLDGSVSVLFGTHTHVQTADELVTEKGTGYITDLGMTGPQKSVLGMDCGAVLARFRTGMPQRFEIAQGKAQLCGCVFDVDEHSGKCTGAERIFIKE